MAITVASIKTQMTLRKKDLSDVGDVFYQWCNAINRHAYRIMQNADPERFISIETVSVTEGTSSYALPSDFEHINVYGTGLYYVDDEGNSTENRLPIMGFGSRTRGFYISGSNIVLTPAPTKSETLQFRYIPILATMSAVGDTFVIPSEYEDYVLNALDVAYDVWDENDEVMSSQRFANTLDEFSQLINRMPNMHSLPNVSNY